MKNTVAMVLAWARQGLTPRRDVVLAFTADEEDTADFGAGFLAAKHADLFEGCTEAIGESGGYAFHQSGVRLYPIAAGERGTAWIRLIARGTAGHGSRINRDNAVAKLAAAVTRIAEHEWPVHQIPTARAAISALTRALGGEDHGGATALYAATLRNSANPTMLQAGYKVNVIPGEARASVDGRVLPGHLEEFETTMADLVGADVTWEYEHREVPLEAPIDAPIFQAMTDALLAVDPGGHVVPYCMAGGTDAKQFSRLGIAGYGFAPLGLPPGYDYSAMFHGVDERVPVAALTFGVDVLGWFLNDY
jgi:acetylornithine deacetylase/succinyl-diaminopimelate desuccinylase-like protein